MLEAQAWQEGGSTGIPLVALFDTNNSTANVDFVINCIGDITEVNTDGTIAYAVADGYLKMTGYPVAFDPADAFLRHDWIAGMEDWKIEIRFIVKTLDNVDAGRYI